MMSKWKDLKPIDWGDLPQKLRNSIKPQMDSLEAAMTAPNNPTPEVELVERTAKAIHDHWKNNLTPWEETCGKLPGAADFFRDCATACLSAVYEALKEPSDAALSEAYGMSDLVDISSEGVHKRADTINELRLVWRILLASALSSPLGKGEREAVEIGERKP